MRKRLQVGVGNHEFDAFHAGIDHAVDRVVPAPAHADDLDLGVVAGVFVEADANVVFFFHVRRLQWIFSCLDLFPVSESRFVVRRVAPPVPAAAVGASRPHCCCLTRRGRDALGTAGETPALQKPYAPLPTNMAFSLLLQRPF